MLRPNQANSSNDLIATPKSKYYLKAEIYHLLSGYMNILKIQTLILGLILFLSAHSISAIVVITSENQRVELNKDDFELLKLFSKTIAHIVEDAGEDILRDGLPLPSISQEMLHSIVGLLRAVRDADYSTKD